MGSFPAARLEASLLGGGEFLGDHMMVFRENGGTSLTYYKGGLTPTPPPFTQAMIVYQCKVH